MTENRWLQLLEENPGHSDWYIERFRSMAAEGKDLDGEARLVDAMVGRSARILDAGCGTGRVGGRLAELGHRVVGVDLDPVLIEAARADQPAGSWVVGDLSELDLARSAGTGVLAPDDPTEFDAIVSAGNVVAFLDPATRRTVLERLGAHLAADGRLVVGFGAGRDYEFDDFFADADSVGLAIQLRLSTWDLRPFGPDSDFLVAIMGRAD